MRILVLTDSIGVRGWIGPFSTLVAAKAVVTESPHNARSSTNTKENIVLWLKEADPDLVIWNNGIWDAKHDPDGSLVTGFENYRLNLLAIARILKICHVPFVWLTTTPVGNGNEYAIRPEDINHFNAVARSVMKELHVRTLDLGGFSRSSGLPHLPDRIHYTSEAHLNQARFLAGALGLAEDSRDETVGAESPGGLSAEQTPAR